MRHMKSFNPLNRNHAHRRVLYRNMLEALFKHERIRTTKAKAKEIRRIAEKYITKAKNRSLHNIRIVNKLIKDKKILMKLFDDIAPRYETRNGGYTRVIKLNRRKGDGAELAYLELVEELAAPTKKKGKRKKVKKVKETQDVNLKKKTAEVPVEEEAKPADEVKPDNTEEQVEKAAAPEQASENTAQEEKKEAPEQDKSQE